MLGGLGVFEVLMLFALSFTGSQQKEYLCSISGNPTTLMCSTTILWWGSGSGLALQTCLCNEKQKDYRVVPPIYYESHVPL